MKTGWRGIGMMAGIAVAIGTAGFGVTGCGLDVPNQVEVIDDDTTRDDPVESIVPVDLDQSGLRLEASELPDPAGR
jgi:hypothetical protein